MLYPAELWLQNTHSIFKKTKKTERGGFEPPVPLPVQLLSREPDSTALAPLQELPTGSIIQPDRMYIKLAEREGFEPPETRASTVFKTASFNRSDISPIRILTIAMV